jgi:hypothetical protein
MRKWKKKLDTAKKTIYITRQNMGDPQGNDTSLQSPTANATRHKGKATDSFIALNRSRCRKKEEKKKKIPNDESSYFRPPQPLRR